MLKAKLESLKIEKLRPFLIPGAIVILILTSSLLLIQPKIGEIFLIQKNLGRKEEKLARLTAKTAVLEGLDQVELSSRVEIAAKAFLSDKNLPLLLSTLKNLAAKNNIELLSLQVEPGEIATVSAKEKKEELSFLSFEILVGGQMSDFKEFLAQTAKVAPLMVVREVDIKEGAQAALLLDAPFLPPPVSLASVETPLAQITHQEENIYQKLARLDFSLIEEVPPSVPSGKENPFAF
jgi:hypothetical protein